MTKLQEILDMKTEMNKKISEFGKEALKEEFTKLFDAAPQILAVKWNQYTPYFNDGDSCTFGVGDLYFKVEGVSEEAGDYGDGWISSWDDEFEKTLKENPAVKAFKGLMGGSSEVLEVVFGDHVEVTVTRDGEMEVENYEHD